MKTMTYNLNLEVVEGIMKPQIGGGYGLRNGCFRDAEPPRIMGL